MKFIIVFACFFVGTAAYPKHGPGSRPCSFPFRYKGRTYHTCTTAGTNPPRWWCGVNTNEEMSGTGRWAYCEDRDSIRATRACQFPFHWNNAAHYKCTELNHHRPWCYFEGEDGHSGAWGDCL